MYDGYLSLGGVELINSARVAAYIAKNAPSISLRNCVECGDLAVALDEGVYESPIVDNAPWFDPNVAASNQFYGMYPLSITGMEDSTRSAMVTEGISDGGSVGSVRLSTRSVRVRGLLIAGDDQAMSYGMSWLRNALDPSPCTTHGGSCGGAQLCYYSSCPEVCEMFEPAFSVGSTAPILNETPQTSPIVFREGNYEGIYKSRFLIPNTEGTIIEWGAVEQEVTSRIAEHHGLIILRRVNYIVTPSGFAQAGTNPLDFWTPVGGTTTFVADPGGDYIHRVGGDPIDPVMFSWTGTANASTSEQRKPDGTLLYTNTFTNPGFETASGTADVRRNAALHPNAETASTAGWGQVGSGTTVSTTTAQFHSGTRAYEVVCNAAVVNQGITQNQSDVEVTSGTSAITSLWVKAPLGATMVYAVAEYTSANAFVADRGTVDFTGTGDWQRISLAVTKGAANKVTHTVMTRATAQNITFWVDDALIEVGSVLKPYFDGLTAASGDFTYVWAGTANASASIQRGVGIASVTSSANLAAIQSTEWVAAGVRSARLIPTAASNNDTYIAPGGDIGGLRLGMLPGKFYTVGAKVRLTAPQTGTITTAARRIMALTKVGAAAYVQTLSSQAANVAGETELRLTFAVPAGATEAAIRLYNGASLNGGEVWWDGPVTIVEVPSLAEPYTGPLFSGDTSDELVTLTSDPMVAPNRPMTVSFDARASTATIPLISAYLMNETATSTIAKADFLVTDQWRRYSFPAATGGPSVVRFETAGEIDIRNIMYEAGVTPLPYTDGSVPISQGMAGYIDREQGEDGYENSWLGTPYRSPSRVEWVGDLFVGVPADEDWVNYTGGQCKTYPWMNVVQGSVDGEIETATRLPVPASEQVEQYERTLHEVTVTEGPIMISERHLRGGGVIREVDFIMVAGRPSSYGPTQTLMNKTRMIDLDTTAWIDPDCSVPDPAPIIDPDCPPVPAPPRPPSIPNACVTPETSWQRYWLTIPSTFVSSWSTTSPTITISSGANEIRQVRVRAYPNAFQRQLPAVTSRVNLLRNPMVATLDDYVMGASGTGITATLSRLTIATLPGADACARTAATAASTGGTPYIDVRNQAAGDNLVTPGQQYTFSAYSRSNGTGRIWYYIEWLDAGGATLAGTISANIRAATTDWVRSNITGVAPALAVRARVLVRFAPTTQVANGNYIDMALPQFEQGTVATSFFSGATPNAGGWYYSWTGAANLSQSLAFVSPVDPCSYCSEFVVSYLPARTELTVDAILERAFASVAGGDPVPANHLLYAGDGSPMTWPELTCGTEYLLAIDVPEPLLDDVTVSVTLATKE